ncbi:MAG TPA: SMI1/KNR4 family protein, partial [Polyangiaceae bacterium]|nr:SMI1/KNR4 family protein [Polyangiaceae bacterium]
MFAGTQRLLQHARVVRRGPASAEDIERVQNRFQAPLPEALVELWRTSDGLSFGADPKQDGQLYGTGSVGRILERNRQLAPGLLPFVHDGQSNFLGLHVHPPLAPRISYLPHDDGPSLFYRDFDSCLGDIARLFDTEMSLDEYLGSDAADYARAAPRDAADDAVARQLLGGDEDQLVQAVCLLNVGSMDIWPRLLEGGYHPRRSALLRLKS